MRLIASLFLAALLSSAARADTLIVANKVEHTVSFIDLETGEERVRTSTGRAPHEAAVSPDGRTAVVVSYRERGYDGQSLHVFDFATGARTNIIDIAPHTAPHGLKWIPGTRLVIATTEATEDVILVDVDAGAVVSSIRTDQRGTHMVALSPDARRAYTGNIASGTFTVVDLETRAKVRDVKAGRGTEAITATPDGKEIWVGNNSSRNVMVFDAATFERLATIGTEGVPIRVEISPDGRLAAVSEFDRNVVGIYETASRERIAEIDLRAAGGTTPVTLLWSPDGALLWAAATRAARVIEIDAVDWTVRRTLLAGAGSDGLAWSPIDTAPAD
ncbi:MAG: cytochrome D1 domain-containing protein [Pseudomonadota bacterium]